MPTTSPLPIKQIKPIQHQYILQHDSVIFKCLPHDFHTFVTMPGLRSVCPRFTLIVDNLRTMVNNRKNKMDGCINYYCNLVCSPPKMANVTKGKPKKGHTIRIATQNWKEANGKKANSENKRSTKKGRM